MAELTPLLVSPEERRDMIRKKVIEGLEESFPIKSRNKTIEVKNLKFIKRKVEV